MELSGTSYDMLLFALGLFYAGLGNEKWEVLDGMKRVRLHPFILVRLLAIDSHSGVATNRSNCAPFQLPRCLLINPKAPGAWQTLLIVLFKLEASSRVPEIYDPMLVSGVCRKPRPSQYLPQ